MARTFRRLAIFYGGGIPAASLKDLASPVRDEHIRRVCGNGKDYPALAPCHDLAPREHPPDRQPEPSHQLQPSCPLL